MASGFVGIDIGSDVVKLAFQAGSELRLVTHVLPDNVVGEDGIVSPETLADFIKTVRAEDHISARNAALVLSESEAYFRHVSMPPMNVSELKLNLPYEFRDFIDDDPANYVFDYVCDHMERDDAGKPKSLELYAAAARKSLIEQRTHILRRAGLRLKLVHPAPMAYTELLRHYCASYPEFQKRGIVLVDIGYSQITLMLFKGDRHQATRTIDLGCRELDQAIADQFNVDIHTAGSYKPTNYQGVLDLPTCQNVYDRLALETNKVVNFYNFSHPDSEVAILHVLGGGAEIPQLVSTLRESMSVPVMDVDAMMPVSARGQEHTSSCALAVAVMAAGEEM